IVHFGSTTCSGTPPAVLTLTSTEVSRLLGGDIRTWNDPELVANNAGLASAGCTGSVRRIVRQDVAGTTAIVKDYLSRADNLRATSTSCAPGTHWDATAFTSPPGNTTWPTTGTCSSLTQPTATGSPAVVTAVQGTDGAIGFAELPEAVNKA